MRNITGRFGASRRMPPPRRRSGLVHLTLERLESLDLPAPLPPTNVTAIGTSASTIALSWDASPDPAVTDYDVYSKVWVVTSHGVRGSSGSGHYVYTLLADVTTNSATVSGLTTGKSYNYVVTAVDPTGPSVYSLPATAETWVAPSQPYSSEFELSSGAVWSGPVNVTAGTAVQVQLLIAGNPLNYSVASGPSTVSIDQSGVVTYTPDQTEVGLNSFTFNVANALGSVSQTIQFNVTAATGGLATPTVSVTGGPFTYSGYTDTASATAVGTDGVTPVSGSFTLTYNGHAGGAVNAGTYNVVANFTSSDPNYDSTYGFGTLTIDKATPTYNYLTSQTIAQNTATTTVTGYIWLGSSAPAGEYVFVTLNGVSQAATVGTSGQISATFATAGLAPGNYPITYEYPGDANLTALSDSSSTLTVIPDVPPQITLNPTKHTVEAPDPVSFSAAASGVPTPNCQWQVSTDGGVTFSDISGATGTTYTISSTYGGLNGNYYRAVFSNGYGSPVTTTAAKLTVQYAPVVTADPAAQTVAVGQAATFTAAANGNQTPTVQWQISVNGGAFTNITGATGDSYSFTPTPADNGDQFRAAFTNDVGTTYSAAAPLTVVAPVTIAGIQVNDGNIQRSEVKSLTVTFSGPVSFAGGDATAAFQLQHLTDGNNVILSAAMSTDAQGRTVVSLTFSGAETDPVSALNGGAASLADGRYSLTVLGSAVTGPTGAALDGDGDGAAGGNYVSPTDTYGGTGLHLYRLFGDVNGDGVVDATDVGQLKASFNAAAGSASYLWYLDADNSGSVDAQDIGQFKTRFNTNVF